MQVKKLIISNFKGIKSFKVDLKQETTIRGENATGKTTVADSYFWLLRGKNSEQSADFEVQPIGQEDLLTSVKIELEYNNENHTLEKTLQSKIKKDGTSEREFIYYVDDVPSRMKDFDAAVAQWFGNNFMLLSDPKYFSTDAIKGKLPAWQERRNLLFSLDSQQEPEQRFNGMLPDDRKKVIKAQITKLQNEIDEIPARIDEVARCILAADPIAAQNEIEKLNQQISDLNTKKENPIVEELIKKRNNIKMELVRQQEFNNSQITHLQQKLRNLEEEKQSLINDLTRDANAKYIKELTSYNDGKLFNLERNSKIKSFKSQQKRVQEEIDILDSELVDLRHQFKTASEENFVFTGETTCSSCGQYLPEEKIQELKYFGESQFNDRKSQKIAKIQETGKGKKDGLTKAKQLLSILQNEINTLTLQLVELKEEPIKPIVDITTTQIDEKISKTKQEIDNFNSCKFSQFKEDELNSIDNEIVAHSVTPNPEIIANLEKQKAVQLAIIEQHKNNLKSQERIEFLKSELKRLQKEYLQLEKEKNEIEEYIKQRVNKLETSINSYFKFVKFQLFETLQNGEIKECCKVLVNTNGVFAPYSDANHAGRVNAGIDIINCFSNKYNVYLPIFIDFRESVSELIETKSQIVNLYKDSDFKKLVIGDKINIGKKYQGQVVVGYDVDNKNNIIHIVKV